MDIIFTDIYDSIPEKYHPVPASVVIPDWYKEMNTYKNGGSKSLDGNANTTGTIKKCMPVFDALTIGYILVTPADIFVTQRINDQTTEKEPYYEWSNMGLIQFHPLEQAPTHPNRNNLPSYPKFMNPWAIKTPKGYSVLFTQPVHRHSHFKILDGVVDTDTYTLPVNFPFVLNDKTFEGIIPAGTPMAQVIPFKRDTFKMKLGTKKERDGHKKTTAILKSRFFDSYKLQFRQKKEYK